jgi:hypothetical protein
MMSDAPLSEVPPDRRSQRFEKEARLTLVMDHRQAELDVALGISQRLR